MLIATIGLPRSGKSTWAKTWEEYDFDTINVKIPFYELVKEKRIVIYGDSIRTALHGDIYHHESESHVFSIVEVMIRCLLNTGHTVCFDECNTSVASIYGILKLDPNAQFKIFDTSEEECIERAKKLGQDYLIPVIERSCSNLHFLKTLSHPYTVKSGIENIRYWVKEKQYSLNQLIKELAS